VSRRERQYVLDTNLFVRGFREPDANRALTEFHRLFAPFEYLCAVVAQELRDGTRTPADRRRLERHVLRPYERRSRVITPSRRAWNESGNVLAELARQEGLDVSRVSKAFGNDILLALCCRESGMVLITENRRDFERIDAVARFEFVDPWPTPVG
jgi:predicted nucleic acid-binding protein